MVENVISEAVSDKRIILIVGTVSNPVVVKFLRAENENRLIPVLVIFDDRKCRKRLSETYRVGKYAPVMPSWV